MAGAALGRSILIAVLLVLTACSIQSREGMVNAPSSGGSVEKAASLSPLRALDETGSAAFVKAFDEAKDRTRFIVALSPT